MSNSIDLTKKALPGGANTDQTTLSTTIKRVCYTYKGYAGSK